MWAIVQNWVDHFVLIGLTVLRFTLHKALFLPRQHRKSVITGARSEPRGGSSQCNGKIITLNNGYGFIKPIDGSPNLFVHHSSVENGDFNELQINDSVEYDIAAETTEDGKSPPAVRVRKV